MTGRIWSRIASGAAILAVAAVAGLISYTHIYDLTLALHQSVLAARLMPVAIDGLILMGSVVLLQSGSRLGWLGVGPGVALSLFANVESGVRYGPLSAVWAAIPSVSFFLATFIFERWLIAQAAAVTTPAVPEVIEAVSDAVPSVPGNVDGDVPVDASVDVSASTWVQPRAHTALTVTSRAPRRASGRGAKSPARIFADEISRGSLPSVREVKRRAHCGNDRARAIRDELTAILQEAQPEAA